MDNGELRIVVSRRARYNNARSAYFHAARMELAQGERHFPFSILNFPLLHRLTQLHILGGIYFFIIDLHLKMQMRAGGVAGIAGKRDLLSLADYIADRHEQL